MAKKSRFWITLAVALVVGLVLLGCPTETEEEKDTWSNVTKLDQMNGTWKGSYSQTMTIKEAMEENEGEWTSDMQTLFGDMKVITSTEMTITIKATDKKQSSSIKMTQIYSGGNIVVVWAILKESFGSGEGVTTNDANHSISMTYSQPEQEISDEDIEEMFAQGVQINQNGTKIKVPADKETIRLS